jgi:hypothetical protein
LNKNLRRPGQASKTSADPGPIRRGLSVRTLTLDTF